MTSVRDFAAKHPEFRSYFTINHCVPVVIVPKKSSDFHITKTNVQFPNPITFCLCVLKTLMQSEGDAENTYHGKLSW